MTEDEFDKIFWAWKELYVRYRNDGKLPDEDRARFKVLTETLWKEIKNGS